MPSHGHDHQTRKPKRDQVANERHQPDQKIKTKTDVRAGDAESAVQQDGSRVEVLELGEIGRLIVHLLKFEKGKKGTPSKPSCNIIKRKESRFGFP